MCACVCTYQEPIVYLLAFARFESRTCFSMCLHTLRAESSFERIKSWECVCMCCACLESGIFCIFLHLLRADQVSLQARAERVYTCFCMY
jgi:hypothetical protein